MAKVRKNKKDDHPFPYQLKHHDIPFSVTFIAHSNIAPGPSVFHSYDLSIPTKDNCDDIKLAQYSGQPYAFAGPKVFIDCSEKKNLKVPDEIFEKKSYVTHITDLLDESFVLDGRLELFRRHPGDGYFEVVSNPMAKKLVEKSSLNTGFESSFGQENHSSLSDIKIAFGDEVFEGHKIILAAQSSVFSAMFRHEDLKGQFTWNRKKFGAWKVAIIINFIHFIRS